MSATHVRRVWASLTSVDIGELVEVAQRLEAAGVDGLHVDVCDGVFVPDLTFGHRVVSALVTHTSLTVEAHLMVVTPEEQLRAVADAGASRASFHVEATRYPWRVAALGRALGLSVGVAVNPATPLAALDQVVPACDFINVLTTEPDGQGELMLPNVAQRVAGASALDGGAVVVQVDGGITPDNLSPLVAAGACEVVVGRALVADPQPAPRLAALRSAG